MRTARARCRRQRSSVGEGEIVALVGGSGCGKTTLLRLVAGLDQASAGAIRLDGETIAEPHPAVGIVFQEPRLLPWLSVADNVAFGLDGLAALRARGAGRPCAREGRTRRACAALAARSLGRPAAARRHRPRLRHEPEVLLLDEPFSALDAFTRASLHEHLLALWEETRPTVVLVTHDVQEAVTLADRAIVMQPKPGRIFDELPLGLARPREQDLAAVRSGGAAGDDGTGPFAQSPRSNRRQRERDRQAAALWW